MTDEWPGTPSETGGQAEWPGTPSASAPTMPKPSMADTLAQTWPAKAAKGIYELGKSVVTAPGEAVQGAFAPDVQTPGVLTEEDVFRQDTARKAEVNRATDIAAVASPVPAATRAGVGWMGVPKTKVPPAAAAPTMAELDAAATAGYHAPEVAALKIRPEALTIFGEEVAASLTRDGFDPLLAPKTFGLLQKATQAPEGVPFVTATNVQTLRRMLGKAAETADKTERTAAQMAQGKLDEFMGALPANAVLEGDAAAASAVLSQARGNYAAMARTGRFEEALTKADRQAGRAGVGGNIENATRQRITEILNSPAKSRGLSKEEKAAMEDYVAGNFTRNSLRVATKILGGDNPLMAAIHGAMAFTTYGLSLAAPLTGYVLKKISNAVSEKELGAINELLRSRSPLAKEMQDAVASWANAGGRLYVEPSAQNVMSLGLSSKFLANQLRGMGINVDARQLMAPLQAPGIGRADEDQQNIPRPPREQKNGGAIGNNKGFAHGGKVPPVHRRKEGGTYHTPKGPAIWRGKGWEARKKAVSREGSGRG